MAKLNKEELEQIVKQDLPGYKLSGKTRAAATDSRRAADDEIRTEKLRRKYLGADAADDDDNDDASDSVATAVRAADGNPTDDDDEVNDEVIVAVEPETANHPWDRSARPKAAVISKKEKKVIGQQG